MTKSLGLTVFYKLTEQAAIEINRRRQDATDKLDFHRDNKLGVQLHVGNNVNEGDVFPLIITKVWGTAFNGQVMLDGNDTYWARSTEIDTTGEHKAGMCVLVAVAPEPVAVASEPVAVAPEPVAVAEDPKED